MRAALGLLAALVSGSVFRADASTVQAPSYTVDSVVNAADNRAGPLAPNSIATIYGTGLAYSTKALSSSDLAAGLIPSVLPGTGVRVRVGGIDAGIYYVSPTQINFLVPAILLPGKFNVQVALDALAGPLVPIQIAASGPACFELDASTVIAARPDGSVLTADNPGKPGDYVVLYTTGLGQVNPLLSDREIPTRAATIKLLTDLKVMIDGAQVSSDQIVYAGVTPGFGGLYQINLKLPDGVGANPEIQVLLAGQGSPAGLHLPIQP